MFRLNSPARRHLTVTAIADDLATLESLEHYLRPRVTVRVVPQLAGALSSVAASDAVVFYPDGFGSRHVRAFVRQLLDHSALSLVIAVTADPKRFRAMMPRAGATNRFIVLAQPAWPWELLTTIQATLPCLRREASPC
jgi:hypothetical protein